MDEVIDKHFARVEKALATLITSISTYNPNPAHANDLVTADAELSQGLEQLSKHQSNYAKILSLRAQSATLDTQIRDTLILLTTTRKDLISIPSTSFPPNSNPVSYSELLSYARRISRYTLPPNIRDLDGGSGDASPKDGQSQPQTNGTTTPVVPANGVDGPVNSSTAMDIDIATPAVGATSAQTSQDTGVASTAGQWETFFNTASAVPFVPWPNDESIRRGALASIQVLLDQGKDPAEFDPEKSAELEAEMKRKVEEEDRLRELDQAKMEEDRRREIERRMSIASGGPSGGRIQEAPKFQLDTFDDDDDEDED